jgi:hypothetical protein
MGALGFQPRMGIEGPKSFHNSFAILILGLRWTGTSKLDGREGEDAEHGREDASPKYPGFAARPEKVH